MNKTSTISQISIQANLKHCYSSVSSLLFYSMLFRSQSKWNPPIFKTNPRSGNQRWNQPARLCRPVRTNTRTQTWDRGMPGMRRCSFVRRDLVILTSRPGRIVCAMWSVSEVSVWLVPWGCLYGMSRLTVCWCVRVPRACEKQPFCCMALAIVGRPVA